MTVSVKVNWRNKRDADHFEPETFGLFKGEGPPPPAKQEPDVDKNEEGQTLTFEVGLEDSGRNVKQFLKTKLATPPECLRLKHPAVSTHLIYCE